MALADVDRRHVSIEIRPRAEFDTGSKTIHRNSKARLTEASDVTRFASSYKFADTRNGQYVNT